MKVLILAFGTRGDVQPFVALARELHSRGHEPVLAAPRRFAPLATDHAVPFTPVDDGPLRMMNGPGGVGDTVQRGLRGRITMARAMPGMFGRILDDATTVATTGAGAGAEVIVHNGQIIAAPHLAELLAVPSVLALTVPMYLPTREFAWPGLAMPVGMPGPLNRASFLGMRAPELMFSRVVDGWRRTLGLPRRRGRHNPLRDRTGRPVTVLNAVSRHVVAPPSDWPDTVATTGYWFLPAATDRLPGHVCRFLDAGPPPVLVGFGSMSAADPAATTRTVLDALACAGVRAILATGWGGLSTGRTLPDGVIAVDDVPHDLLLPHVAAVVHHGGAGTTAAAAAAAAPQVICPFVADQPFWGHRLHALGVAPAPLPQRRLTAAMLAAAITHATTDPSIRSRAGALAVRIRHEPGTTDAVTRLEALGGGRVRSA